MNLAMILNLGKRAESNCPTFRDSISLLRRSAECLYKISSADGQAVGLLCLLVLLDGNPVPESQAFPPDEVMVVRKLRTATRAMVGFDVGLLLLLVG